MTVQESKYHSGAAENYDSQELVGTACINRNFERGPVEPQ